MRRTLGSVLVLALVAIPFLIAQYPVPGPIVGGGSGGGGGTPGGSSGQVQINSSGSFGGTSAVPVCAKYTVAYSSLTAAATTQTVDLVTVPAASKVWGLTIKEGTQFASGTLTTLTVSVGNKAGTVTEYAPAFSLMQTVTDANFYDSVVFGAATWASHTISVKFTGSGNLGNGSASNFSAGSVDIWACSAVLP